MRENRKNQTKNRRNGKKNCAIFRLYQMIQLTNLRARRLQDITKTQMEKEKGYETEAFLEKMQSIVCRIAGGGAGDTTDAGDPGTGSRPDRDYRGSIGGK